MTRRLSACLALALLLVAGSAWAHHSTASVFDFGKRVTLTGTLTKVQWTNPHIEFTLEANGESWLLESISPSSMSQRKVGKANFQKAIGQTVTVEVSPARDGSRFMLVRRITLLDGTSVVTQ